MNTKDKKILAICGGVLAVLLLVVGIGTVITMNTDKGKDVVAEVQEPFKPVQLPASSRDLTQVPEAPVHRQDKNDDKNLNVDMRGKKIVRNNSDNGNDYAIDNGASPTHRPGSQANNAHRDPTAEEMRQISNVGVRFKVPSVGLDVPLGEMDIVNNVIKPTNYTSMFAIRNKGVKYTDTKNGTTYMAAHALDHGLAVGNWLIDSNTRQARIHNGDVFTVGNVKFKVTGTKRIGKGLISSDKDLWNTKIPNRAVILSCFPSSNDNFITYAQRI